jgi:hypothetical protein
VLRFVGRVAIDESPESPTAVRTSLQMQEAGWKSGLLLIPNERRVYGASSLILVAQFPRDVRVPPQEPIAPVRYSANVQV